MKQFTKDVRAKGWTLRALSKRWGRTTRQLDRISSSPNQIQIDALAGLPDRSRDEG